MKGNSLSFICNDKLNNSKNLSKCGRINSLKLSGLFSYYLSTKKSLKLFWSNSYKVLEIFIISSNNSAGSPYFK